MPPLMRFVRFNLVGALGIGVQLLVVATLVRGLGVGPVAATTIGVLAAVLHNFGWHVRWTWRDRMGPGVPRLTALVRFAGANGAISLVGSVLLLPVLGAVHVAAVPANLVTIAACGLLNYSAAGRVFRSRARRAPVRRPSAAPA
jgi:putative flippase GtrA